MIFDHIHQFFSFTGNIPIVFKWLGRVVAPIFMFLTVEGYIHTRDKKKYMLRLYIGSVFMGIGNKVLPILLPRLDGFEINNNIFATLLMIVIYMGLIDYIRLARSEQSRIKILLGGMFLVLPFVIGSLMITLADLSNLDFLRYILPNVFLAEGGPALVALGVIFYLTKDNLYKLLQSYIIFCAVLLYASFTEGNHSIRAVFCQEYQWMMVFAVYFFKRYNGEKGRGLKYLFYIFYPVHIYLFYTISYFVMN